MNILETDKNWLIVIPAAFENVRTSSHICLEKIFIPTMDLAIQPTTPQPPYITQSFTHMHWTPAYTAGFLFAYSVIYMYAPSWIMQQHTEQTYAFVK